MRATHPNLNGTSNDPLDGAPQLSCSLRKSADPMQAFGMSRVTAINSPGQLSYDSNQMAEQNPASAREDPSHREEANNRCGTGVLSDGGVMIAHMKSDTVRNVDHCRARRATGVNTMSMSPTTDALIGRALSSK